MPFDPTVLPLFCPAPRGFNNLPFGQLRLLTDACEPQESKTNKKGPANFAGPFPMLKPEPDQISK
jgi:hypothetical protein